MCGQHYHSSTFLSKVKHVSLLYCITFVYFTVYWPILMGFVDYQYLCKPCSLLFWFFVLFSPLITVIVTYYTGWRTKVGEWLSGDMPKRFLIAYIVIYCNAPNQSDFTARNWILLAKKTSFTPQTLISIPPTGSISPGSEHWVYAMYIKQFLSVYWRLSTKYCELV